MMAVAGIFQEVKQAPLLVHSNWRHRPSPPIQNSLAKVV